MALLNKSIAAQQQQQQAGDQSYLTPQMAQLLSQQGVIPQQIAGIDDKLASAERRADVPLPQSRKSAGGWTTAPHWTEALSHVFAKTQGGFERRGLEKTREKKAQELADYGRDAKRAELEQRGKERAEDVEFRSQELDVKKGKIASDLAQAMADKTLAAEIRNQDLKREDERDLRTGVRALSEDILPQMETRGALQALDNIIAPYMPGGEKYGEDVPGIGQFEGGPGMIGSVVRTVQDFRDEGSPRAEMYARVRTLLNKQLRENAGLAQTLTEIRNTLLGTGLEGMSDEEVFIGLYPEIRRRHNEKIQATLSGYDEQIGNSGRSAASAYQDRFGEFKPLRGFEEINQERMSNAWATKAKGLKPGDPSDDGRFVVAPDGVSWVPVQQQQQALPQTMQSRPDHLYPGG